MTFWVVEWFANQSWTPNKQFLSLEEAEENVGDLSRFAPKTFYRIRKYFSEDDPRDGLLWSEQTRFSPLKGSTASGICWLQEWRCTGSGDMPATDWELCECPFVYDEKDARERLKHMRFSYPDCRYRMRLYISEDEPPGQVPPGTLSVFD